MATVFKAERSDQSVSQTVAIKILHSSLHSQESLIRFRMEQEILANLNHPNIAHFVDAGMTKDDNPYFIMEYVEGVSITEYCKKNELPKREKLQLFRQLCEAVCYAHRNLVVHRDLKPNNVFVNKDGKVKVLDFSIAKLLDPEFSDLTMVQTRAGTKLLSPTYCAPEQFLMDPITTATDVYTLGLILYEILSGKKAVKGEGKTLKEIENTICKSDFSRTLNYADDTELQAIILKATRKEPEYRYESAGQLLEDLTRYEESLPLLAQQDSFQYRLNKFVKRNRRVVGMMVIILITSAVLAGYHYKEITEQREISNLEAERARIVTDYLIDLFELANPVRNQQDTLTVFDMLEFGEDRIHALDNQPELQLSMTNALGQAHYKLGDYRKSYHYYSASDSLAKSLYPENHLEVLKTSLFLGDHHLMSRNYKEAYPYYQKAVKISEQILPSESYYRARSYKGFGSVLTHVNPDSAKTYLFDAIDIYSGNESYKSSLLGTMSRLGIYYRTREEFLKAEKIYTEMDSISKSDETGLLSDKQMLVNNNLGYLNVKLQNFERALEYYLKAYDLASRTFGKSHPNTLQIAKNIRSLYGRQGKLKELEQQSYMILELVKENYGYEHWSTASELGSMAIVQLRLSNVQSAYEYAVESFELNKKVLGNNHDWTLVSEITNSLIQLDYKRNQDSKYQFEAALSKLSRKIKDDGITMSAESNLNTKISNLEAHSTTDLSREIKLVNGLLTQ